MSSHLFTLLLLALLIVAQVVPFDKTFDCTNTNFRVIYTACHAGEYSQCCAVGTDCCAGACCPGGSYCVGQGTSNEKCCQGSDSTDCGLVWLPDVICDGMDGLSSFACPHGSTCDLFSDVCDTPAGGTSEAAQPTSTKAASSAEVESSQATKSTAQVTSIQVVTSAVESESTVQSVQPGTVTVVSTVSNPGVTPATTSGVASVSVVTLSATQAAATTSKSMASTLNPFSSALALAAGILVCWWL